jgi:hypothetical protein
MNTYNTPALAVYHSLPPSKVGTKKNRLVCQLTRNGDADIPLHGGVLCEEGVTCRVKDGTCIMQGLDRDLLAFKGEQIPV